jgi:hypothetical protein
MTALPTRLQSPAVNDAALPPVRRRTDLLALALLILIATVCFSDVLLGINELYMRDMTRYYYPTKQIRTGTATFRPDSRSPPIRSMRSSIPLPG